MLGELPSENWQGFFLIGVAKDTENLADPGDRMSGDRVSNQPPD